MRTHLRFGSALCCALLATCTHAACDSVSPVPAASIPGPDTVGPGRYTLAVDGMSCPKCISNVDFQLVRIPGVKDVAVDMKGGLVHLTLADGRSATKADLARAVTDAGFTLTSVREDPRP